MTDLWNFIKHRISFSYFRYLGIIFFLGSRRNTEWVCQECNLVQFYYRPGLPLLGEKVILCLMLLTQEAAVRALSSMATQTHSRMTQQRLQCYRNNSKCRLPSSAEIWKPFLLPKKGEKKKTNPHIKNIYQKTTRPNFPRSYLLKISNYS